MSEHPDPSWQPTNPPVPQQPRRGWFARHKVLTILVGTVLLVLLCCGGLGIAMMGGGDTGGPDATGSSSTSESAESEDEPTEEEPEESLSVEQENAIRSAEDYLAFMPFSKQGLIEQLSSEAGDGYPRDVAEFAVEHIEDDVDWNEQAVKSAENYLDLMPFSRAELIDQLSSDAGDGFTREQAEYAADQVGL